ncbi:MAG TPA: hypothetical protein DEA08_00905 [Planctomycetes bacterium]|nr:hypothetical protein [Planctomycetota bacterium]
MPRALPWLALLTLALVGLAAPGLTRLEVDTRNESFFVADDPALRDYERLLERFGSDEVVFVLVEVEDAFAEPHLGALLELGRELAALPEVRELRSPLHAPVVLERAEVIEGVRVSDEPPASSAERAEAQARVLGYAPFVGRLIDAEGSAVGFLLSLEAGLSAAPARRAALAERLESLLARGPWSRYPSAAVGTPLNQVLFARILRREMSRSLALALLVAALVVLWLFGHPFPALPPALVIGGSLVATFGAMGQLGVPLTMVSAILLTFLVCVGTADAMHLTARYRDERRGGEPPRDALARALRATWWPCLLTTLTTGAGFLALGSARLAPLRDLGFAAAGGTLVAYALTFTLVPVLLPLWRRPPAAGVGWLERGQEATLRALRRRPRAVVALGLLLTGAAALGLGRLRVDHDFLSYLDPSEPLRRDLAFVQERIGGAVAVEVVLDAGHAGGVAEAGFQRELFAFAEWLREVDPLVRAVEALDLPLAETHALFGDSRGPPESDAAAAQLLLALELADPAQVAARVSTDQAESRLSVRMDVAGSARYSEVLERIEAEARRRFVGARLSGSAYLLSRMKDHVLQTQRESFAWAFALVSLLIALIARAPALALAAALCNLAPLALVLGLMGWLGISLEVSNALLATVALGVVVDDTIHVVCELRAGAERGLSLGESLAAAYRGAGRAILFTTLLLGLCFLTYQASALSNVRTFGLLAAATFTAALLADLVLFPALLLASERRHP